MFRNDLTSGSHHLVEPPANPPWNITIQYDAKSQLTIKDTGGYESRNESTIHLLLMAMNNIRTKHIPLNSFSANIVTEDSVSQADRRPCLAYCATVEQSNVTLIPDHVFWGWPEVGISNYEATVDEILRASQSPYMDPRCFWIGNVATHPTRAKLMEIAQDDERIRATGINWLQGSNDPNTRKLATKGNEYVSLPDHCRYQYLIDLQGNGYSGRLKLLLFSGRLLFIQKRVWREFFYDDLKPFEHFIPVREDLSDLSAALDWADAHRSDALDIASNAQRYAKDHLRQMHAVDRFSECLLQASEGGK